jgi:hypothetical protein
VRCPTKPFKNVAIAGLKIRSVLRLFDRLQQHRPPVRQPIQRSQPCPQGLCDLRLTAFLKPYDQSLDRLKKLLV